MNKHFRKVCRVCAVVLAECRCPAPTKEIRRGICEKCYDKEAKKLAGLEQIETAQWQRLETGELKLSVTCSRGLQCDCYLSLRPAYCDRGHIMLQIDGFLSLDDQDRFPRYFFSFEEANEHVRTFLKWRLWKHRTYNPGREFK